MKKSFVFVSIYTLILAAACSSDAAKSNQDGSAPVNQNTSTANVNQKGKALMQTMDCIGCHKEQGRIVGPSYAEIAAKYKTSDENMDYLASKIISGGSGVWGDVAMGPHPNLSKDDAIEIVKYILTVK